MAMGRPWIKLYTEMLDDPKMGDLSSDAYRRFVEMLLYAGQVDDNGRIASTRYVARKCFVSEDQLLRDIAELVSLEMVHEKNGEWYITKWAARQPKKTSNDRVKAHRKRKRSNKETDAKEECNVTVTLHETSVKQNSNVLDKEEDKDKELEEEKRERENAHERVAVAPSLDVPAGANGYAAMFKTITGIWVGFTQQDYLQERLGENPDWKLLGQVFKDWSTRGNNPRNLNGIFDWYDQRLSNPNWQPYNRNGSKPAGSNGSGPKTFGQMNQEHNQKAKEEFLRIIGQGAGNG